MELQESSSEGSENRDQKGAADELWPSKDPVPPICAGLKLRLAPRPSGENLSPPHVGPSPAAVEPQDVSCSPPRDPEMAHYEEVRVSGFEEFNQAVEQHNGKTIFAYFTGSKDAGGKSWCPDCVQAEPVVREGLKHVSEGCVFIYCQVGERPYWKDPNNDFRKNLKVTAVPTLLKYGTPQKLVESECLQASLVEMLFSED
ncbi:thioredoxin domain-containing protein 17 [Dasypus novemcinctus]|uniref:thioredoxin domain-containing protein 17 n=1 Tax=Dasypus novemcinctus TaxID=9361 RepID=UPI00265D8E1D|nr:thioredoxin domain-containing protein 17 isoform X1 [Dasypus novemcinctus]XP_058139720.1 thioredoxin domain-containing protein 17 isoform X1 [Dasypus novemcinctus]